MRQCTADFWPPNYSNDKSAVPASAAAAGFLPTAAAFFLATADAAGAAPRFLLRLFAGALFAPSAALRLDWLGDGREIDLAFADIDARDDHLQLVTHLVATVRPPADERRPHRVKNVEILG